MHAGTAKDLTSLRIHAVLSEPLLFAYGINVAREI